MQTQKGVSTSVGLIIIVVTTIILFSGIFIFQYLAMQELQNQEAMNNVRSIEQQPITNKQNFSFDIANNNIEVKDKTTENLIQKIPLSDDVTFALSSPIYSLSAKDIVSLTDDINFDGYKDLEVLTDIPADNPGFYDYFIYDPLAKKFEADPTLKNLCNPSFNPTSKTIKTYMSGGCAGGVFSEQTFSFVSGNYTLTETREGSCCSDVIMDKNSKLGVAVSEYQNGKIESTRTDPCPTQ